MAMFSKKAVERRLGLQDARGPEGVMGRGANVYNGGTPQAQSGGGPQYGRPPSNPQGEDSGSLPASLTTLLGSLPPQAAGPPPGVGGPPDFSGPPASGPATAGVSPAPGLPPGLGSAPGIAQAPGLGGGLPPGLGQQPPGQGLGQQGGSDPLAQAAIMAILQKRFGANGPGPGAGVGGLSGIGGGLGGRLG